MRVDDFLKIHIQSINGTMKLMNAKINQIPIKVSKVNQSPHNCTPPSINDEVINYEAINEIDTIRVNDDLRNLNEILDFNTPLIEKVPNQYIMCNKPVRTITSPDIHTIPLLETEDTAEENWGIKLNNPRKKKPIYLTPNREILLRNLDSRAKTKIIGLL